MIDNIISISQNRMWESKYMYGLGLSPPSQSSQELHLMGYLVGNLGTCPKQISNICQGRQTVFQNIGLLDRPTLGQYNI